MSLDLHSKTNDIYLPPVLSNNIQNLKVQPSQTESPLSHMPIRALEIRTSGLALWGDIPTPTSLVRDQWQSIRVCHGSNELGVGGDGAEPVGDGESRAPEGG